MNVVYAESAPLRQSRHLSFWPAKHAVARAIAKDSNEAILVTGR